MGLAGDWMIYDRKVLSVNHHTGDVIRIHSGEAVRCCTKCTLVLDHQLSKALQVQRGDVMLR